MIVRGVLGGLSRRTALVALTVGILAVCVPSALAAALTVRVNPAAVRVQSTYQVEISGSFKRKRAYLVAFIQYSSKLCKANATQELHRTRDTGGAYDAVTVRRSPLHRTTSLRARSRSARRVCAYLFARHVNPGRRARPLARASASYQVI